MDPRGSGPLRLVYSPSRRRPGWSSSRRSRSFRALSTDPNSHGPSLAIRQDPTPTVLDSAATWRGPASPAAARTYRGVALKDAFSAISYPAVISKQQQRLNIMVPGGGGVRTSRQSYAMPRRLVRRESLNSRAPPTDPACLHECFLVKRRHIRSHFPFAHVRRPRGVACAGHRGATGPSYEQEIMSAVEKTAKNAVNVSISLGPSQRVQCRVGVVIARALTPSTSSVAQHSESLRLSHISARPLVLANTKNAKAQPRPSVGSCSRTKRAAVASPAA